MWVAEKGRAPLQVGIHSIQPLFNLPQKDAAKLNAKEAFDVLIIGGGPAGAAASIAAATAAALRDAGAA